MTPNIVSRRAGKQARLAASVRDALTRGEHVHVAEAAGTRCANNTCPADADGCLPKPKGSMGAEPYEQWIDGHPF